MSSSNPRNDAALLHQQEGGEPRACAGWADFGAMCPPRRDCDKQGCAVNGYANHAIKRDQERGYPFSDVMEADRDFERTARGRQKWSKDFNV